MNKVSKKGYVPNKYTGRSMMMYGGMQRKKAAMGYSVMDENMDRDMKKKMEKPRGGYAYGGKLKSSKADITAMEKACSAKAGKNKSVAY